jgi:hypothetical protein
MATNTSVNYSQETLSRSKEVDVRETGETVNGNIPMFTCTPKHNPTYPIG